MLTIAIPTYNRNEYLIKTIASLLPQLNEYTKLLIIDNKSQKEICKTLDENNIKLNENSNIIYNKFNIGSMANILKCFEVCGTDWLWICGDDDVPKSNAIDLIYNAISINQDASLLNFMSHSKFVYGKNYLNTIEDLINPNYDITRLTLISNNVYKCNHFSNYIKYGYTYSYSLWPHLAILLWKLHSETCNVVFINDEIIEWSGKSEWSRIIASLGMPILWDMPISHKNRKGLINKFRPLSGKLKYSIPLLLKRVGHDIDANTALYLFKQIVYRNYAISPSFSDLIYNIIGSVMLRAPNTSMWIYSLFKNIYGKSVTSGKSDEYERI